MEDLKKKIEEIEINALKEIENVIDFKKLTELKIKYLGKKSELFSISKQIGNFEKEERKEVGEIVNKTSEKLKLQFDLNFKKIKKIELEKKLQNEKVDITLPGEEVEIGKLHPLTQILNKITEIFISLGFLVVKGPEIETDYYNFEALNIPKNHPARDTQDTFYVEENLLLRTQTSPVQIRIMEKTKPPIKIISPGRVYRADSIDATHSPVFNQVEGLLVDEKITMANLKATLEIFIKKLCNKDVKTRFRPHHFPFTEPSAEMDIECFKCGGKGCSLCKNEGFIEILGCGMVHPKVLENCNINPSNFSGFAFGLGLERIAMLFYDIKDLRLFYENNLKFLKQF